MNVMTKEFTDAVEKRLDGQDVDLKKIDYRVGTLEMKAYRPLVENMSDSFDTMGAQFIAQCSGDFGRLEKMRGRVGAEVKATLTSGAGSGAALVDPQRDTIALMPRRRLAIRQLLTVVNVSSGTVEYPRMTTRPASAAPVAEAALKPESELAFELKQVPIRTIAHWLPASVQILADEPQLQSMIDGELRYGLALAEESQLLYGSGVGANLSGMVTQATAYAKPVNAPDPLNMVEQLGLAILQAQLTDVPVDGVVVHPTDWMRMRLLKDGQGNYLLGKPNEAVPPSLFGLPVVTTVAMQIDKFLVGGFAAQTLYDRQQATVDVSIEHADFFTRNLVAVRCEERIGFAAKQPQALIYGDFGNVA